MKSNDTLTEKREDRVLSLTAFILFLAGFFLPLFSMYWAGAVFVYIGVGATLLAFVFGLMSWRRKLGKVAAIGAGLVCLISIINLIRFCWY